MTWPSGSALRLVLALVATGALGVAVAAQSAPAAPQISAFGPGGGQGKVNSTYLAGYQVTEPGISRASVAFDVPTMNCGPDIGGTLEGIGNEQVEQNPTVLGFVYDACVFGSPQHSIGAFARGEDKSAVVDEGDRIKVTITQTPTLVKVIVTDVTAGPRVMATATPTPDNSLTIGSFPAFSGPHPVADFGTVRMLHPTIENTDLSAWSPTRLNRRSGSTTQISTTQFNGTTGAFSLVFQNH